MTGERGTWTLIYDQSIVVSLPDTHKAKYVANLRYSLKDGVDANQYDSLKCGSYEAFDSTCTETMVGVKFNEDKMVQCWTGRQTSPFNTLPATEADGSSAFILAQTSSEVDEENDTVLAQTHSRLGSFSELSAEARIELAN